LQTSNEKKKKSGVQGGAPIQSGGKAIHLTKEGNIPSMDKQIPCWSLFACFFAYFFVSEIDRRWDSLIVCVCLFVFVCVCLFVCLFVYICYAIQVQRAEPCGINDEEGP
jgi:hypothetical protein